MSCIYNNSRDILYAEASGELRGNDVSLKIIQGKRNEHRLKD